MQTHITPLSTCLCAFDPERIYSSGVHCYLVLQAQQSNASDCTHGRNRGLHIFVVRGTQRAHALPLRDSCLLATDPRDGPPARTTKHFKFEHVPSYPPALDQSRTPIQQETVMVSFLGMHVAVVCSSGISLQRSVMCDFSASFLWPDSAVKDAIKPSTA